MINIFIYLFIASCFGNVQVNLNISTVLHGYQSIEIVSYSPIECNLLGFFVNPDGMSGQVDYINIKYFNKSLSSYPLLISNNTQVIGDTSFIFDKKVILYGYSVDENKIFVDLFQKVCDLVDKICISYEGVIDLSTANMIKVVPADGGLWVLEEDIEDKISIYYVKRYVDLQGFTASIKISSGANEKILSDFLSLDKSTIFVAVTGNYYNDGITKQRLSIRGYDETGLLLSKMNITTTGVPIAAIHGPNQGVFFVIETKSSKSYLKVYTDSHPISELQSFPLDYEVISAFMQYDPLKGYLFVWMRVLKSSSETVKEFSIFLTNPSITNIFHSSDYRHSKLGKIYFDEKSRDLLVLTSRETDGSFDSYLDVYRLLNEPFDIETRMMIIQKRDNTLTVSKMSISNIFNEPKTTDSGNSSQSSLNLELVIGLSLGCGIGILFCAFLYANQRSKMDLRNLVLARNEQRRRRKEKRRRKREKRKMKKLKQASGPDSSRRSETSSVSASDIESKVPPYQAASQTRI